MRCTSFKCSREARLVIDLMPAAPRGKYLFFCWPCYRDHCKQVKWPMVTNYIDQGDKDDALRWDPVRHQEL